MSERVPTVLGFFPMLWRVLLAAGLVFVLSGAGGYLLAERLVRRPEVKAPNLLAVPLPDALERASGGGFPLLVERREPSNLLEDGQVLSQRPAPDMWVKEGSPIRVVVASRP